MKNLKKNYRLSEVRKIKNRNFFKERKWKFKELKTLNKLLKHFKLTNGFIKNVCFFKDKNLKSWFTRYRRLQKSPKAQTKMNYLLRLGKHNCAHEWEIHSNNLKYSNSKQYLIDKYGIEEAEIRHKKKMENNSFKNSEIQRKNSLRSLDKRRANPELYDDIMPNQIKYYLKKGLSEEDAKAALKERQTTFTLEKCIKRHGLKEGTRIFNERNERWLNTLNSKPQEEIDAINRRKNPLLKKENESKNDYIYRTSSITSNPIFDSDDLIKYIDNRLKDTKWLYLTKEEFIKNLPFIGNANLDVHDYLESTKFNFPSKNLIKQNKRGSTYLRIDEGMLRSYFEIDFYTKLRQRNIKFLLDNSYPDSKLKYDFYLVEYNIYVEIAGQMFNENYRNNMYIKNTLYNAYIIEPSEIDNFFERIDNNEIKKINSDI